MADIPLQHDGEEPGELCERCCFCRTPTRWWTNLPTRKPGEQVACCEYCAGKYKRLDVPSKLYWCEKEYTVEIALYGVRPRDVDRKRPYTKVTEGEYDHRNNERRERRARCKGP